MIMIRAIVRPEKVDEVLSALMYAGYPSVTKMDVFGQGKGKVDYLLLQGAQQGYDEAINQLGPGPKLIPKRMLTVVVPNDKVDLVVRTIIRVNKTGSPGDGKIFVGPVADAIRVRTGETGDAAVADHDPAAVT